VAIVKAFRELRESDPQQFESAVRSAIESEGLDSVMTGLVNVTVIAVELASLATGSAWESVLNGLDDGPNQGCE
jgi:hypothetical protein